MLSLPRCYGNNLRRQTRKHSTIDRNVYFKEIDAYLAENDGPRKATKQILD